jgi:GMP synthase-like glutamine amidotransferase
MAEVLVVDLWPEVDGDGCWKPRFAAIPSTARRLGVAITVLHYQRLDPVRWAADPPAGIMLSGSSSNLVADLAEDPEDGIGIEAFSAVGSLLASLPQVPVFGICFGLQYLTVAAGGTLTKLPAMRSEPAWPIELLADDELFAGLPAPRLVENHRWQVERPAPGYQVVARSADGIEALRHCELPRVGVQFHPEYFVHQGATRDGERLLSNWLGRFAGGA